MERTGIRVFTGGKTTETKLLSATVRRTNETWIFREFSLLLRESKRNKRPNCLCFIKESSCRACFADI